jgi:hypothetical protein
MTIVDLHFSSVPADSVYARLSSKRTTSIETNELLPTSHTPVAELTPPWLLQLIFPHENR